MKFWYTQKKSWVSYCLWPLSCLYRLLVACRYFLYKCHFFTVYRAPVPVIVVGNISVGGVGKSPLVADIVKQLSAQGRRPGIVSRGYGGRSKKWPVLVRADSDPALVGDEPVMLAQQTSVPVVVSPNRPQAIKLLLDNHSVDVVVSDDGLQHYAMARDMEIVVMDKRGVGNGLCLPAGPLREPKKRLNSVSQVVINGKDFMLSPQKIYRLDGTLGALSPTRVHAVAAIGDPTRFFDTLIKLGFEVVPHPFADHHQFSPGDLSFNDDLPVVMTEKDAVKVRHFAQTDFWVLPVELSWKTSASLCLGFPVN